jgi:hypothetical protein
MDQQNDPNGFAAPLSLFGAPTRQPELAPAVPPDPVAIFSAPDVVFHWWTESKRRWAEQNRSNALIAYPIARVHDGTGHDDR